MTPAPTPTNSISGSFDMLRNADVGHMLELRERMSEVERELAKAKAEREPYGKTIGKLSGELSEMKEQAERLAGALKRYRMPHIKDDEASRAEFGELAVSRELEARKELAAWEEGKQP